jgi:hypothetical protein
MTNEVESVELPYLPDEIWDNAYLNKIKKKTGECIPQQVL